MKSKKTIAIAVLVVAAAVLFGITKLDVFRDFDAKGYVDAVLKQTFEGTVEEIQEFVGEKTQEELKQVYEAEILSFVESNITAGVVGMDEELKQQYIDLCKEIFASMKMETSEATKISRKEYHVSVSYEQVDVFQRFTELVPTEKARIEQKVQNGEYKGTLEEINQQMQDEYLVNCYELFKKAFEEMQVTEKGSMVFVVKENEDGLFGIDDSLRTELIIKIMGLDENQD